MKLEVNNLTFYYSNNKILDNVSFSCQSGEIIALLGRNGSGKTTLLKNILGLLTPRNGEILIDGKNINNMSIKERGKTLSYIPQNPSNIWSYSVNSYVLMGVTPTLSTLSSPKDRDNKKAEEALKRFNIGHLKDRDITTLSGGEKQLATAARALLSESKILLFDEPTSALDIKNSDTLIKHIKNLSNDGYISIITMHDVTEALNTASRIIILDNGKVFFNGLSSEVTSEILTQYYQCPMSVEKYKGQYILLKENL